MTLYKQRTKRNLQKAKDMLELYQKGISLNEIISMPKFYKDNGKPMTKQYAYIMLNKAQK
jgi:hypothetical protein